MKPLILKAENSKEISKKAQPFLDKKFKVISEDKVHIILKKRNFGSIIIHILFWILILFAHPSVFGDLFAIIPSLSAFFKSSLFVNNYYYIICSLYIIYVVYYLFTKTKVVLITTETLDKDGNPLEFSNTDEIDF